MQNNVGTDPLWPDYTPRVHTAGEHSPSTSSASLSFHHGVEARAEQSALHALASSLASSSLNRRASQAPSTAHVDDVMSADAGRRSKRSSLDRFRLPTLSTAFGSHATSAMPRSVSVNAAYDSTPAAASPDRSSVPRGQYQPSQTAQLSERQTQRAWQQPYQQAPVASSPGSSADPSGVDRRASMRGLRQDPAQPYTGNRGALLYESAHGLDLSSASSPSSSSSTLLGSHMPRHRLNSPPTPSQQPQRSTRSPSFSSPGRQASRNSDAGSVLTWEPEAADTSVPSTSATNLGTESSEMSALLKVFGKPRSGSVSVAGGRLRAGSDAEVSATVLLWHPGAKSSSSALSRNPLFRDASSMKQKLSKRGSSSTAQFEVGPDASFGSSPGIRPSGHSWLREKPSKNRLNSPLSSSSSAASSGQWKRAVAMFRDNGNLTLFGEDHAMIHAIQCSALSATDVRPVDDSLFGRSYVLGIYPKPAKAHKETSITVKRGTTAPLADKLAKAEPVFLQLATQAQLQYWLALLRIYVQPEIFGSPASVELGGTHRVFRQIDLTIYDAKSIMPMWPTDLLESPKSPRSPAVPITGLYQQASGSGGFGGGGDAVRSVSSTLGTLRQDMFDDSPSSETFGGDGSGSSRPGSRPSSRTNSRPGSRPNSRVRHNAKVSVGNIRAQDPDEGSGSSRPASQAASNADVESQNGDDASSWDEPTPGPIAGSSGAARFQHDDAISIAARSTASAKRREERELYESTNFDRYCRVRVDGELMARTSVRRSAGDTFKVDKICLRNLPEVGSLTVEVLHPTLRTSSGLAGSPSSSISKYMLLGVVEIPIDSLRRNEEIEGRFPIWSVSSFAGSNGATGSKDHDDDGKIPTSFHRGVVGELKLSIKLREETVLPLSMYEEVDRRIHAEDAAELIQGLTVTLREDAVISYLVRIYAASGTITERISSLIDRESADWGDRMEPELLFRANTLLSRSVDHLQRLLALAWLDECLGPTVRKVCNDPASERPTTSSSTGSDRFDDSRSTTQQLLSGGTLQSISSIPDGPMTTNALRKLCETMWHHIYSQRHRCPSDLRTVLHRIRTKVNERYKRCQSTRPGIQGVGAFVFLRLFCAALNAPQLYGLTPSQPSRTAQRKLLLLSKVLLALASKKTAFDQEKDWELASLNDFLRTYSSAYDDYITVVSTEPPKMSSVDVLGSRYEDDGDLQACASRRLRTLPMLHKESVPTAPYMLDRPLALASFVSYIVNTAEEKGLHIVSALDTLSEVSECDASPSISGMVGVAGADRPDPARRAAVMRRKVDEFVDICCQIEEAAGMCIEGAGYNPRPIPFDRLIVRR